MKRFGGEEQVIARLNSLHSLKYMDNCLYIKDIERESIKCTFKTSFYNAVSIVGSLKENMFKLLHLPGVDVSLSLKEIEKPMYAIPFVRNGQHNYFIDYFQKGKFGDSKKRNSLKH